MLGGRELRMQQIATTSTFKHGIREPGPFVIPVHAVERVRFRTRLRRARRDFLPLYVAAGVAGVACGFILSLP
jgi:hypothetical protein